MSEAETLHFDTQRWQVDGWIGEWFLRNQSGYSHYKPTSRLDKVAPRVKSESTCVSPHWSQSAASGPPQGERNPSCSPSQNQGSHIYTHVAKNLGAAGCAKLWPQEE